MSFKQPHVILVFENDCYLNDNLSLIEKLSLEFTVFHTSISNGNFHKILAQNKIHVILTFGSYSNIFNSLILHYGNKLNDRWIHISNGENKDYSSIITNCFFNSQIMLPQNNTISYFITAYNSRDIIYRPYNSLLQQTYLNWELVIIDDSDKDNGETERIIKEIASSDFRVKYFRSSHSGFIGEVKNYAARLCTGYVICELDHDDEVTPDLTKSLHDVYSNDKDLIFVSTNCCELYDDTQENSLYGEIYDFGYGSYVYEWHREKWRAVSQSGNINNTTVTDIVGVPNHIRTWRASALFDIGYNNSSLYIADDYELILRTINYCFLNNKKMLHLPIMGYYQYRNRQIGNHTFKRLEQIRKVQNLCSIFYNDSVLQSVVTIQNRRKETEYVQRRWDNYEGERCIPIWKMPWNWHPNFINSPEYIFDEYKVSIVISTYKRKELLLRAINSCLNQTYQNFEIIIVGDNCPELENFMNNEYNGPKEKIRWFNLYSNCNDGGTTPKNYALRMIVRTNLICYLDDDNIYTPEHLESLVQKFKDDRELKFAFSSMEMTNYKIICREPKHMRIDTSTFMHKKSLLYKYGYWKSHKEAGYAHDWELVSRWVSGGEKWSATEKVTMIYNMETQSLNNPKVIYEVYNDQVPLDNDIKIPLIEDDDIKIPLNDDIKIPRKELKIINIIIYNETPEYNLMKQALSIYLDYKNIDYYFCMFDENLEKESLIKDRTIYIKGKESYIYGILYKTLQSFKIFDEYDYIIRSNISSFIDFDILTQILSSDSYDYTGGLICPFCTSYDVTGYTQDKINLYGRIPFVEGTCIILSKNAVKILLDNEQLLYSYELVDELAIGLFFNDKNLLKRLNYSKLYTENKDLIGYLVYRNKRKNRIEDIKAIFEILKRHVIYKENSKEEDLKEDLKDEYKEDLKDEYKEEYNIFVLCYNEEFLIPHMVNHYRKYIPSCKITIYDNESNDNSVEIAKSLGCEVVIFSTNNKTDNHKFLEIKNNCWKHVKSGWIIVIDMDEFLCVTENQLKMEKENGTSILTIKGIDMIGESKLNDISDIDLQKINRYLDNQYESKKLCFLRQSIDEINYTPGAHSCNPIGNIKYSKNVYINRHNCFLGLEFLINRYKERFERSKEERSNFGFGIHYIEDVKLITEKYNIMLNESKLLVN